MSVEGQTWQPGYWETAGDDGRHGSPPEPLESPRVDPSRCALWMKIRIFSKDHKLDSSGEAHSFNSKVLTVEEGWALGRDLFFALMTLMEEDYTYPPPTNSISISAEYLEWASSVSTDVCLRFRSSPSECQLCSWQMLRDWWDGTYQDPKLSRAVRTFIREAPNLDISSIQPKASLYQQALFALWNAEFNPSGWTTGTSRGRDVNRSMAFEHAMAQKGGYLLLCELRPEITVTLPHSPDRSLSKSYDNCPWLPPDPGHDRNPEQLPLYLWDKVEGRTRKVTELLQLGFPVTYTCVSHTWGRRKKRPVILSRVKGVPWEVPENTLFNVTDLPSILLQVKIATRFFWFDLVCLPQDTTTPEYLSEVSRQATIFHHASACVAWINTVSSWRNLQAALRWLCLNFLYAGSDADIYNVEALRDQAASHAQGSNELISSSSEFALWLSSTWTLQESCLCPDITLYNQAWEPLELVEGTTVSLHQMLTLYSLNREAYFELPTEFKNWPLPAGQLAFIQTMVSGMDVRISRVGMLGLGATRECERRRADAVMSAMGVTDWYVSHLAATGLPPPDKDLVLASYPLSFVMEAAAKIGAEFFESFNPEVYSLPEEEIHGTLLPFGRPGYHVLSGTGLTTIGTTTAQTTHH